VTSVCLLLPIVSRQWETCLCSKGLGLCCRCFAWHAACGLMPCVVATLSGLLGLPDLLHWSIARVACDALVLQRQCGSFEHLWCGLLTSYFVC
jgi:hypothetical protein